MDLTNISVLIIPIGITTLQSGIKINETNANFVTKLSIGSLFSLLAIMLSFMKIMSFENVILHFSTTYSMGGFDFAVCFFVLIAILLLIDYIVIDQLSNKFWRSTISALILLLAIVPSFFIIFYERFLTL